MIDTAKVHSRFSDRGKGLALRLVRMLLGPSLRFALRNQIGFSELVSELKEEFVRLANEEFTQAGTKSNVSRLSVVTGISRRDVTRIIRGEKNSDPQANLVARVLVRWELDKRYQTKAGKPKILTYQGDKSEFKELVQSISKDINSGTLLFELERTGAIERTATGIKLVLAVARVVDNLDEGLSLLARDCDLLVHAVEENLYTPGETRNLHLRTEYDNIFLADIPQIREWIVERGKQFHKDLRQFLTLHDKDHDPTRSDKGGGKVAVTAFSWTTQESTDES